MTGRCGKWPWKKGSLMVTFLMASMRSSWTISVTRSMSRNG